MAYIATSIKNAVRKRATYRCEYCLQPEQLSFFAFEMEHIIAEKHGGLTHLDNLALSCPFCNRAKGSDLGSLDPLTGLLTPFFNPRIQIWEHHFYFVKYEIMPLTPEGRVTVQIFQMNLLERLLERATWIDL
jgi:HNH endonuclease